MMGKSKKIEKPGKSVQKDRKKWQLPLIFLVLMGLAAAVGYNLLKDNSSETAGTALQKKESPDFKRLIGSWVRPDGGYVIEISKIHPDGAVALAYFNPRPINVARASVSETDGVVELFVELRDLGYPGSTYTLKYNPEHDVMIGVYFQAAIQQPFDVIFQRK